MRRRHALVEEALVAFVFWRATDLSPWPGVALGEAVAISWGVILIVLTSPSRGR